MNARLRADSLPTLSTTSSKKLTTVFMSGNSQAARTPKEFQRSAGHVSIELRGVEIVIKPQFATMAKQLSSLPPQSDIDESEWDEWRDARKSDTNSTNQQWITAELANSASDAPT